jgi:sterol carrier protein 2
VGRKVYVVGVGMTKFEKPGAREGWDYPDMALEAGTKALEDSRIPYSEIDQACVGYVYGESTSGQRAVYGLGLTGIPVYNVNNNCSTGSTALFMAKQLIEGGLADCVLALGFEKMAKGSLGATFMDRTNPMDKHMGVMVELRGFETGPPAAQIFGNAGREHMERYGTTPEHFAKIAYKNHLHSTRNPYSQFQDEYTLEQIQAAPVVHAPLTKLQCCPTSDGSAAAVLCSEEVVERHGLERQAVEIAGMAMTTDFETTFSQRSSIKLIGSDMTRAAAHAVYEQSGLGPEDVDVIELHDCFSANELVTYEALGLCAEGKAGTLIDEGATSYGGQWVVNPSGGLISKGHPLGATGLAQCSELSWQLRDEAGERQVDGAKVALQHNLGLGGAAVVTMYRAPVAASS